MQQQGTLLTTPTPPEHLQVFTDAAERSTRAKQDAEIAERVSRLCRRMHQEHYIKLANYLQYGILMPWLVARLISSSLPSLYAYRGLPLNDDSWLMDIMMDAKGGVDPGKPGDLLRDSIEHILVLDARTALYIPPEWPDDHPFKAKNTDWERSP